MHSGSHGQWQKTFQERQCHKIAKGIYHFPKWWMHLIINSPGIYPLCYSKFWTQSLADHPSYQTFQDMNKVQGDKSISAPSPTNRKRVCRICMFFLFLILSLPFFIFFKIFHEGECLFLTSPANTHNESAPSFSPCAYSQPIWMVLAAENLNMFQFNLTTSEYVLI